MKQHFLTAAEFVKAYMKKTERPEMGPRRTASFRWRHTLRVLAAAREIGRLEGADMEVVEMACILHDVAKLDQRSESFHHAVLGSRIAGQFLAGLHLPSEFSARVVEAVRFHSLDTNRENLRLETLVLKDADRLDEVGALGVLKAASQTECPGGEYRHCATLGLAQLERMATLPFFTAAGRELFNRRLEFMREFWGKAEQELAGEKIQPYAALNCE